MLKRVIIFLLLVSSLNASFLDENLELFKTAILPGIVLIVTALLGIMLMLSDILRKPELKAWVKNEIREMFAAGIITVIVLAMFLSANGLSFLFAGDKSEADSLGEVASERLTNSINNLKEPFYDVVEATHYMGVASGMGYSFSMGYWFFSAGSYSSPFSGFKTVQTSLSRGGQGTFTAMFIYMGILSFLKFFTSGVVSLLVPFALALRFIPFTRKVADSLIALMIGVTILFPLSIIAVDYIHQQLSIPIPSMDTSVFEIVDLSIISDICASTFLPLKEFFTMGEIGWILLICPPFLLAFPACAAAIMTEIYPGVVTIFQYLMLGLLGIPLSIQEANVLSMGVGGINSELMPFLGGVNTMVVLAIVDLLIILILTYGGIRAISTALGGEQYFMGIQRLV